MLLCTVLSILVQSILPLMSVSQQFAQMVMRAEVMNANLKSHTNLFSTFTVNSMANVVNRRLLFTTCQTRSCIVLNVSAVDDIILETEESCNLTLERTPDLNSRVILDPVNGVVEVADNYGRYHSVMIA